MYKFENERREQNGVENARPASPPGAAETAETNSSTPNAAAQNPAVTAMPEQPGTSDAPGQPVANTPPRAPVPGQPPVPTRYNNQYNTQSGNGYYGAYYNGPYYNSQNTAGGFHSPGTQPGWAATQPGGVQPPVQAAPAAAKAHKGPGRVLGFIALLLVAALCGFGGGYVANLNSQGSTSTVVYRVAEGATANRTGSVDNLSVSDIAAAASESVVSITTENIVTNPFMGGQIQSGAGSGVIISENGYIITNNHVISGADNVIVTLADGTELPAEVIGADATSDVAVVKVDATGLVPAVLGDSEALAVGDMCLAIGNPMGTLGGTVTDGIISAINREITIDDSAMTLLQMSAAVSPGNSGGGLFNANAELIGVVNAKSGGEGTEGLGFAIPINTAIQVAQDLIDLGYVTGRPALGVQVEEIATADQALQRGLSALGVYINEVTRGGAAETAGMQAGDMIVSFDGREITSTSDLTVAIQNVSVGDTVEVVVSRGGERVSLQVVMQEKGE